MWTHSCAMKKQFMDMIMDWSNDQCLPQILKKLGTLNISQLHDFLPRATKHFLMHAFSASGWNLWTRQALTSRMIYLLNHSVSFIYRNFELAKLQYKHLVENAQTEDGYHFKHLLVTLENWKGWQSKLSKEADLQGQFSVHKKGWADRQYCQMQVTNMKSTPSQRCLLLIWSSTCKSGLSFFASLSMMASFRLMIISFPL